MRTCDRPRRRRGQADEVRPAQGAAPAARPDPARARARRRREALGGAATLVVVGPRRRPGPRPPGARSRPTAVPVPQAEQRGTGHAVRIALDAAPELDRAPSSCSTATCRCCARRRSARSSHAHEARKAAATVLTAEVDRPDRARPHRAQPRAASSTRSSRSATPPRPSGGSARSTPGVYAFDAALLREALGKLSTDNDQGEEYLTDVIGLLVDAGAAGRRARRRRTPTETLGCNDRAELAGLRALLRDRINDDWMRAGRHHHRPGDHLDRRHRHPRPGRGHRARTPTCAAPPRSARARSSARTPR